VRVFLLLALCVAIDAQADPQVWFNPGIYSLHFDRDKDLRDDNIGLGVEFVMAPEHAVSAGTFINSNRERSRYVAYAWRPLRWELRGVDVALGVVASAFEGYPNYRDGGWFLAPLPLLAIEGRRLGVNLSVIPTIRDRLDGAIAIQLKLRVW
jgi:hypothetical protein